MCNYVNAVLLRSISIYNDTATHCNTRQHHTEHPENIALETLQHVATCCNTLQHVATYCNTLQHTATHNLPFCIVIFSRWTWRVSRSTHCNTARLNTLQHTATHCNTLQHTATHCNITEDTCRISQQKNACRRERKWVYVRGCLQGILLAKQGSLFLAEMQ